MPDCVYERPGKKRSQSAYQNQNEMGEGDEAKRRKSGVGVNTGPLAFCIAATNPNFKKNNQPLLKQRKIKTHPKLCAPHFGDRHLQKKRKNGVSIGYGDLR